MSSPITETGSLFFTQLQPNEHVICSIVLYQVQPVKMFAFFGPVIYQPNYLRYYGHLTDKRFILEVFPYSSVENLVMKALLSLNSNSAFAIQHKLQHGLAKLNMQDPSLKTTSIPYSEIMSVGIVKSFCFFKHIKLSIKGAEEFHFNVFPHKLGNMMNLKSIAPSQIKENLLFVGEFYGLFQRLI